MHIFSAAPSLIQVKVKETPEHSKDEIDEKNVHY